FLLRFGVSLDRINRCKGKSFVALAPVDAIETDTKSQQEWIDRAKSVLTQTKSGSGDCFKLLRYGQAS
ncbi:hypothetical protein EOA91_31165, partial [Mesorhizobium sp. M1A.F.Ca.IN.022.04.1.1]